MKAFQFALFSIIVTICSYSDAQVLDLPERDISLPNGDQFVDIIRNLPLEQREDSIYSYILSGNVPEFQRNLVPVHYQVNVNNQFYNITVFVLPDYLAVGCDTNYFLCPMTPVLAQEICWATHCVLPTRMLVDTTFFNAGLWLQPQTMSPGPEMTTVDYFDQHNVTVWSQREALLDQYPLGTLVGGDKKDVVISNAIYSSGDERVVIYGWHQLSGIPIQPLYNGHILEYADYSHGIRLIQDSALVNGQLVSIKSILQDAELFSLFSDEGIIETPWYPANITVPEKPKIISVSMNQYGQIVVQFAHSLNANLYGVEYSDNENVYSNYVETSDTLVNIPMLNQNETIYIKIKAFNEFTSSEYSEVMGVMMTANYNTLIVNGFDRETVSNEYNYIIQYAEAMEANNLGFASCSNDAIITGMASLTDYDNVIYILGEESTADETFSDMEQQLVIEYLNGGGHLFVSGSEIAWDLDYLGSIDDKYFFNNYLKSTYLYDAVNNVSSSCYQAEAISGTFAEELGSILFDNGTFNTYNVAYPDVIEPVNGSFPFLFYLAYPEQYAGVAYTGIFPGGISEGKIVYLGFPFETIVDSITRNDLLGEVFHYFDLSSDLELSRVPYITKVFPNPSNGLVYIKSEQKIQKVRIFNLLGEELGIESVVNVDSICLFFKQNRGVFLIYIYYEDSFSIEKVIIR